MREVIYSKKLLKLVGKTNVEYELIREGDRVLLGLSGGKDSLTLAHILKHRQKVMPFKFEFLAVTISYGMGEDLTTLQKHCREYDIPHEVIETDIYGTATEKIRENSSYCSFFSRMRRGALYRVALERDFETVALGHHLDDAVESFFMNMFYNGVLRSMPPIYKADRGFHVIRPLIEARESQLRAFAEENGFATIGDEACPAMRVEAKAPYARAATKEWLRQMEGENPELFTRIRAAFSHIHDDTFLDPSRWKRDDAGKECTKG